MLYSRKEEKRFDGSSGKGELIQGTPKPNETETEQKK
jgi:hypothetical protein